MARIMGIDYGTKRIGVAVTDPLRIIASPYDTIANNDFFIFLHKYLENEDVDTIVVGLPLHLDGTDAQIGEEVHLFAAKLKELFPQLTVDRIDERFTSQEAMKVLLQSGTKKKKRRDKGLIDKISASIILRNYMNLKNI